MAVRIWLCLVLMCGSHVVYADIWTHTDQKGVIHITNIKPKGNAGKKWKTLYKSGPGKAQTRSGTGPVGCRTSRADVVPAKDRDPGRIHRYDAWIREAAEVYVLPEALIRAILYTESDYDPYVVSCAGARGLMQIMPEVERDQKITDVFEPRRNILGGARLLRLLANRFDGDLVKTIAGYHAGAGAVQKYNGIPPYETTQWYVRTVVERYQKYKANG